MVVRLGEEDVVVLVKGKEMEQAKAESHLIIIVTGYYKLHDLHVFTVDSLHSVQTLGRVIFHSKGHSEISSKDTDSHRVFSRPFCRLFTLAYSAFRRRFPQSASISLVCGGWIRTVARTIQKDTVFLCVSDDIV